MPEQRAVQHKRLILAAFTADIAAIEPAHKAIQLNNRVTMQLSMDVHVHAQAWSATAPIGAAKVRRQEREVPVHLVQVDFHLLQGFAEVALGLQAHGCHLDEHGLYSRIYHSAVQLPLRLMPQVG